MAPKTQKKTQKPVVGKDRTTVLRVEPYDHFGKHKLRPYVLDAGVSVPYICRGRKAWKTHKPTVGDVRKVLI